MPERPIYFTSEDLERCLDSIEDQLDSDPLPVLPSVYVELERADLYQHQGAKVKPSRQFNVSAFLVCGLLIGVGLFGLLALLMLLVSGGR
jgi:hypothetical protein